MYNAKIANNKPVCAKCGSSNISGIRDYREAMLNDIKYVMFQVKCYDCHADNRYLADMDLDQTTRYEIKGNVKEINE